MPIDRLVTEQCRGACATLLWGAGVAGVLWNLGFSVPAVADTVVADMADNSGQTLEQVTITAERLELLGTASSASEGIVADQELQLAPVYRPGQLLETVPGLIVTLHSGEGKANQYLIRGYNLDHGTDFATYVDDMPVNEPTNAHGQGYSDIHFLMPELAAGLDYTKGPFYPEIGDFGAMGSAHIRVLKLLSTSAAASERGSLLVRWKSGRTSLRSGCSASKRPMISRHSIVK